MERDVEFHVTLAKDWGRGGRGGIGAGASLAKIAITARVNFRSSNEVEIAEA
jgi:hypothetical protein